jgi:hypothetical protein
MGRGPDKGHHGQDSVNHLLFSRSVNSLAKKGLIKYSPSPFELDSLHQGPFEQHSLHRDRATWPRAGQGPLFLR